MPDTNINPAPAPAAGAAQKPPAALRGNIKQSHLAEFTLTEELVRSAQKSDYAGPLAAGEIDAPFLTTLLADTDDARKEATTATSRTTGRLVATSGEQLAGGKLTTLLHSAQARARQKYAATAPARLKDYYIGDKVPLDANRSRLEQCGQTILEHLATDALPGMGTAKQAEIAQALQDYKDSQTTQTTAQSGATRARSTLAEKVADIAARRKKIQFAADATWPHEDPANAAIRREFKLPPDMALKA